LFLILEEPDLVPDMRDLLRVDGDGHYRLHSLFVKRCNEPRPTKKSK
jgi:hypothetical protein